MRRRRSQQIGLFVATAVLALMSLPDRGIRAQETQIAPAPADAAPAPAEVAVPPVSTTPVSGDAVMPGDVRPGEAAPDAQAERAETRRRVRERLEKSLSELGFAPPFFEQFKDREPLGEAEFVSLAQLLHGLPQIARSTLLDAAGQQAGLEPASRGFATQRGRAYFVRFLPRLVTRQEVPQALRETLGFDSFYLCEGETVARRLLIATRQIPRAWKLDTPLDGQASAIGLYVKQMPENSRLAEGESAEPSPVLLFATERIAWHPPTLLAHLGVDYGLFDDVKDGVPLENRELFYQMLAAAGGMSPQYLEYQTKHLLDGLREQQERLARIRDLPAKQHAAAERALERARAGASDVVPLFEEPAAHRGEFVILRGEALRASKIRVDDPRIRQQFKIDHYYEVELLTPDSEGKPIVCCLAQLPSDMPVGESIEASVCVPGFFLQTHPFEPRPASRVAAGEKPRQQLAPLVIGTTLLVIPTPKFALPTQSLTMATGVLAVLAACGALMWRSHRADRRAEVQHGLQPQATREEVSLGKSPDSGVGKP